MRATLLLMSFSLLALLLGEVLFRNDFRNERAFRNSVAQLVGGNNVPELLATAVRRLFALKLGHAKTA